MGLGPVPDPSGVVTLEVEGNEKPCFVGDSVTWGGTSIDDDKTFADRTCAELEAKPFEPVLRGGQSLGAALRRAGPGTCGW